MQESQPDEVILFSCAICCPAEQQIPARVEGEVEEDGGSRRGWGDGEQGATLFFSFFIHFPFLLGSLNQ